jgi:CRISPR-associated exonuclease Cas4
VAAVTELAALGLLVAGGLVAVAALRALSLRRREARFGALVAVDDRPGGSPLLRSERYRISGRPDELRQTAAGPWVPIEFKSRRSPRYTVPRSHRIQVAAYCLLVEETTGVAPPYGMIRYGDGGEVRVAWDRAARAELLQLRAEMAHRYDGRATPSVARCARCPWRDACDARAV